MKVGIKKVYKDFDFYKYFSHLTQNKVFYCYSWQWKFSWKLSLRLKNVAKNRRKIICVEKAFTLIVCFALEIDRKIWNSPQEGKWKMWKCLFNFFEVKTTFTMIYSKLTFLKILFILKDIMFEWNERLGNVV